MLVDLLADGAGPQTPERPWLEQPLRAPALGGRISATDRLSWWFRPTTAGRDPWETYFETDPPPPAAPAAAPGLAPAPVGAPAPPDDPPGRRAALRLVLDAPEDELIDADAEAVVTCLYDFVHALGRRDVAAAIDECVAAEYHTLEGDVEVDRDGLAARLQAELDRLRGWEIETSLVEIPAPILHPEGILVYAELQIEARREERRRTIVHRRLAVFRQGRDRRWRLTALSPV